MKRKGLRQLLFDREFFKLMLPLALPIAAQNLLSTSFRLVDTLMIGRLGDISIAAVGLAGYVSFFVELLTFGVASGSAVFLSQYHGAGNRKGILRVFGVLLTFVVPIGVLFTIITFLFPTGVMQVFTDDPALIAEGARYLKYACFSYAAVTLNLSLTNVLRSTENVKIPMWTSGICAAANAVLNYLFIFGGLGIAPMGVAGAGLATAISSTLSPVLILTISVIQRNVLIAPLRDIFRIRGFVREFWSRALPVLLNEGLWSLSIIGINMVFGRMGADNYAALTVVRTVENIVFVVFVGLCNACNIMVGKAIGARQIELGKRYACQFMLLVPVFGIFLGTVVALLRAPVIGLFDISASAAYTARVMLLIYSVDITLRNIPYMGVVGIFRAGGDTKYGLFCDMLVQYVVDLPVVYVLGFVLKSSFLATYAIMVLAEDVVKFSLTLPHFLRMKWIMPVRQDEVLADAEAIAAKEE